jgi:hypothetical protein
MNIPTIQRSDYPKIRSEGMALNHQILKLLSPDDIKTCARHLGLLRNKTIAFNNETEASIFCEYQIFAYRPNGFNMVELYLRLNKERLDTFKLELLRRMSAARYSVLIVDSIGENSTLQVTDIFRKISFPLVDNGLSKTIKPGNAIAGYTISFDDFSIQSGGGLPVDRSLLMAEEPTKVLSKLDAMQDRSKAALSPDVDAKLARAVISAGIRLGYTERIIYKEA